MDFSLSIAQSSTKIKQESSTLCRICLNLVESEPTALTTSDYLFKNILSHSFPNLNLSVSIDPVICHECLDLAKKAYNLYETFMKTEKKILNYYNFYEKDITSLSDLNSIKEFQPDNIKIEHQTDVELFQIKSEIDFEDPVLHYDGNCFEEENEEEEEEIDVKPDLEFLSQNLQTPQSSNKNKVCIRNQFIAFCDERGHKFLPTSSKKDLSQILTDWAQNMKKANGENYKSTVVKTMFNVAAKYIQEKYENEFNRKIDPFNDSVFKKAKEARNARRKEIQNCVETKKRSWDSLDQSELELLANSWDEDSPIGLQRKFYTLASYEFNWRPGQASSCELYHFRDEMDSDCGYTGRIQYNPTFNRSKKGSLCQLVSTKYLTPNTANPDLCPVRILKKLISKRSQKIKSDRLFLVVAPDWNQNDNNAWYVNPSVNRNDIFKWEQESAEILGIDCKKVKFGI